MDNKISCEEIRNRKDVENDGFTFVEDKMPKCGRVRQNSNSRQIKKNCSSMSREKRGMLKISGRDDMNAMEWRGTNMNGKIIMKFKHDS